MGLVIDTSVFILAQKADARVDFDRWLGYGEAFVASITVSELRAGALKAGTGERRRRRTAFVEAIEAAIPVLEFTAEVARVHAQMLADMPPGANVGAHDALIGATARCFGHAVLTDNVRDFARLPRVEVLALA